MPTRTLHTPTSTPNIGKSILTESTTSRSPSYIIYNCRAIFSRVSKAISRLFCCCFTTLCDWFAKFAPLSQPMRTKTTRALLERVFPRWAPVTSTLIGSYALLASVVIGQTNYFGFSFTTLRSLLCLCLSIFNLSYTLPLRKFINSSLSIYTILKLRFLSLSVKLS